MNSILPPIRPHQLFCQHQPVDKMLQLLTAIGLQVEGSTNLATIDDALQKLYFPKEDDGRPKERWSLDDVFPPCSPGQLHQCLAECGFWDKKLPQQWRYEHGGVPGALAVRMGGRVLDLVEAWKYGIRWNGTVLLSGARELMPALETPEIACASINIACTTDTTRSWENINPRTEASAMLWMWENAKVPPNLRKVAMLLIDDPMREGPTPGSPKLRPTTESTFKAWLEHNPKPGTLLLSSGNPYGMAMEEMASICLRDAGFSTECFGHGAPILSAGQLLREVAGCVHAIRRNRGM